MPFVKIWIHIVWSTKNRLKIIDKQHRKNLISHIVMNAEQKKIVIDTVNCEADHLHLLISLASTQNLGQIVQLIKGESAYWWNSEKLSTLPLHWQDGYFAVSISESMVEKIRDYIKNQESHHKVKAFQEEYQEFIDNYSFQVFHEK